MTLFARNTGQLVLRTPKQALVVTARVAMKAARRVIRGLAMKTPDQFLPRLGFLAISARRHHAVSMLLPRPMARLTTGPELRSCRVTARVYGFRELLCLFLVTRRTDFSAYIVSRIFVFR